MEENKSAETDQPKSAAAPKAKHGYKKKLLICLAVLLLVAAAVFAGYWWRGRAAKTAEAKQASTISALEKSKADLQKELAAQKAKAAKASAASTTTTCSATRPNASTINNIESAITSGNTAALQGYMASSVNVIIAASDGLGTATPAQAVTQITNFITSDNTSWDYDFNLPSTTVSDWAAGGYHRYFPSTALVGMASNKRVISFTFDCNGKISGVFVAASSDLL